MASAKSGDFAAPLSLVIGCADAYLRAESSKIDADRVLVNLVLLEQRLMLKTHSGVVMTNHRAPVFFPFLL